MPTTAARSASQADFTFQLGELTTEDLKVTGFTGQEGLSRLFSFRVELASAEHDLVPADRLGQPCLLEIAGASGSRFVHGMVCRFERTGQGPRLSHYAAEVVPAHWYLTKRYRSRIFQNLGLREIIEKVFQDAGIPADTYRFALSGAYPAREYTVQYRESEFDFISRLMEHEGVYYFFEHEAGGHKMVIADGSAAHVASPLDAECVYRDPTGLAPGREYFHALREAAEIQIGATRLKDFDFCRPPTDLAASASADGGFTALEYSDYPGQYVETSVGQRLARVRLEEQQCRKTVVHLVGNVRGVLPGYKFTLQEHPVAALNQEYLITQAVQRGVQTQAAEEENATAATSFESEVRAIPASVTFRPPRHTPKPRVGGSQTALVTGPAGEEIYTDEYGRVKVHFHWDLEGGHDENSSCWLRVSQAAAGGQYGWLALPRIGQEVVVDFLEGDPDQPIITGRVYNNDQMPPYTLPDHKTRTVIKTNSSVGGGGTNEILFEDLKDSEKILIYAQKNYHLRVNADRVENVGNDYHVSVKKNRKKLVEENEEAEVKLDLKHKVGGAASFEVVGKESRQVGGTYSHQVAADVVEKFGAGHKHEVTMTYGLKALSIQLEASTGIEIKCGGSAICLTPAAIFIKGGPLVNINSGSGPPVTPPSASATAPEAPAAPIDADSATPGRDTTYQATLQEMASVAVEALEFTPPEVPETEPVETTWISIEMVDEADQPVAGEAYEIETPDGRLRRGTLDANGKARLEGLQPGTCQVRFPRLDAEAWERI